MDFIYIFATIFFLLYYGFMGYIFYDAYKTVNYAIIFNDNTYIIATGRNENLKNISFSLYNILLYKKDKNNPFHDYYSVEKIKNVKNTIKELELKKYNSPKFITVPDDIRISAKEKKIKIIDNNRADKLIDFL